MDQLTFALGGDEGCKQKNRQNAKVILKCIHKMVLSAERSLGFGPSNITIYVLPHDSGTDLMDPKWAERLARKTATTVRSERTALVREIFMK